MLSRGRAYGAVNEKLIVARRLRANELPENVGVMLDLTCEMQDSTAIRSHGSYVCLPLLDAGAADGNWLATVVKDFQVPQTGRLLIHCANGSGRTGMFATVWLCAHGFASGYDDAMRMLTDARPVIRLCKSQRASVIEALAILGEPAS